MNQEINQLIEGLSMLLSIKIPEIYYVKYDQENFMLMDRNFNNISYDSRDIGYKVISTLFVPKKYVIYINVDLLNDINKCRILIIRKIRYIYQIKQIKTYKMNNKCSEKEYTISQWIYVLELNKGFVQDSPLNYDQNAFCSIVMNCLYGIIPKFEIKEQDSYDERYDELNKKYTDNLIKAVIKI